MVAPVKTGTLGTIKKGLNQDLQFFAGHPSSIELHITLMSTAHLIPKVLE